MNIDWSKAPEGAEFAGTLTGQQRPVFYRNVTGDGYDFVYPDLRNWTWIHNEGQPISIPLIPRGEQPVTTTTYAAEQTRQEIIALAAKRCGISGDSIRQLAAVLAAEGYRKFEIVEGEA